MRETFIDPRSGVYNIDGTYPFTGSDPNKGFRSKLPFFLLNRLDPNFSEEIEFIDQIRRSVPAGSRVLDAGAGQSRYRAAFEHVRYVPVDFAQGDSTWDYSKLSSVCDLQALPFKDASFDAVIALHVLEHLKDPSAFLAEVARVLKPGGSAFFNAPQGFGEHQVPHDYFRFTSFAIRMLLARAGLEERFIRPMGGFFYTLAYHVALIPGAISAGIPWAGLRPLVTFLLKPWCCYLVPFACFYLDRLDTDKGITMFYGCHARRSQVPVRNTETPATQSAASA